MDGGAVLDRPYNGLPKNVCVVPVTPECASIDILCMSEVLSSFRSLIAGSQVFAPLMLFLCVIMHTT